MPCNQYSPRTPRLTDCELRSTCHGFERADLPSTVGHSAPMFLAKHQRQNAARDARPAIAMGESVGEGVGAFSFTIVNAGGYRCLSRHLHAGLGSE